METKLTSSKELENHLLEPPIGAIPENERLTLSMLPYSHNKKIMPCIHRVECRNGNISSKRDGTCFMFTWRPGKGFYFTNYFHALAYSLQIKARRGLK